MQFHEKLYTLRRQFNLTQADLAEKLNVSRQAVSRWEMGTAKPEVDTLIAISDLFGVTLDELLKDRECGPENETAAPVRMPRYRVFLPKRWWLPGLGAAVCRLLSWSVLLAVYFLPQHYRRYYEQEIFLSETVLRPALNTAADFLLWWFLLILCWTLLKWWKAK